MTTRRFILAGIAALSLLAGSFGPSALLAAQAEGPRIDSISVGFEGAFKVGHWTPIQIACSGGGESQSVSVELLTPDTDGVRTLFVDTKAPPLELAPGKTAKVVRYFKPGQVSGDVEVRLRKGTAVVASRRFSPGQFPAALPADQRLIVTVGPSIGVDQAIGQGSMSRRSTCPRVTAADQLPDQWHGYEGVNILVLPTSEPKLLDALSREQVEAIRQWVRMGGRLLLCVGQRGEAVLGERGVWRDFSPGRFAGVVPVRSAATLETYSGSAEPLGTRRAGEPLTMAKLVETEGKTELAETATDGIRPIIVRRALGFGMVVLVAFDLDAAPFATWEGTHRITGKILERLLNPTGHSATERTVSGQVVHEGYSDLVGQLRTAMDEFSGVTLVAFSLVAVLALFYIALIGPGDYFALRRLFGRMEWTWFTFPAIVVAFAAIAILLNQRLKPDSVRLNTVEIVDIDIPSGTVRGTAWAHVYSPKTAAYDFDAVRGWPSETVKGGGQLLSWQGLPGTGLGGMSGQAIAATFPEPYTLASTSGPSTRMDAVPISISASKCLLERWWGDAEVKSATHLRATADGLLAGEVSNPLPLDLDDVVLLYENWAYRLDRTDGKLAHGQTTDINLEHPYNLEWRLMRRRVKDTNDVRSPWDPASRDIPRIVEMMMFHGAAGASSYTELDHSYQGFVDMSDHLTAGRAILCGRCQTTALRLTIDGKEPDKSAQRNWTFVRLTFAVEPYSRKTPAQGNPAPGTPSQGSPALGR